jgi:hypothetical protein
MDSAVATVSVRGARSRAACGLWRGASIATLAALACGAQAQADVTVNGGDTPVATATASAAGADNIVQTGSLKVGSGAAVTLNSSNNVTNSGTIQTQNTSGLTGILALGGNTGSITNSGTITFNSSDTLTTTNSAGVVVGPFSNLSNLYGIRVQGSNPLSGDITNGGTITIQGSNSAGISVEAPLTGAIGSSGTITVSGDNSVGVRTTASVGGVVTVAGTVTASGANTQAVSLGGDAGGLSIQGAVSATGYHTTTRSTDAKVLASQDTADAVQGGAAVTVAGSLAKGLLVSAPPSTLSSTNTDLNGDGIADSGEGTGVVSSYGSAPAIVVGAVGRDIQLNAVGTGDSAYGVVIAGTVTSAGLRDGVAANGVQIGVPGGGAVSVAGGIHLTGTLTATAYGADATALHLYGGASVPVLELTNTLKASVTGASPNAAQGVVVEAGASLPIIRNGGTLTAIVAGSSGSAAAIVDHAGSLTRLENTGTITAGLVLPNASQVTVNSQTVAIDDSANTTGFSLLNYQSSGVTTAPTITGAIKMGSGNDSVDVEAGSITGDLSFGAGANALTINGGATVTGALSADGGTLALSVGSGRLQINSTNRLSLTSLNLGSSSTLIVTADPAAGQATGFDVNGAAQIAQGAKIGLRVLSLANGSQTYALVRATQLQVGALDTSLLSTTPYIYNASLATDAAAGTLSLTLARKTAAQLGLPASVAAAYEPVVAAVSGNDALSASLLLPTDQKSFGAAFNQLLPEHSGGVFQLIRAGVEAFGRPIDDRQSPEGRGAWIQEVNLGVSAGDRDGLPGYRGWGVGLVAGFEGPATPVGVFGATLGGFSGEMRPHDADSADETIANVIEAGGYWRAAVGPIALNARVAADHLTATGHRVVTATSDGQQLFSGTATGHWSGWAVNSRFRVSYEARWNAIYLRPQLGFDYLRLSEDAYTEGGAGAIDLAVGKRTTSELSGFAGAAIGAMFGDDGAFWGPELLLGYRDVFSNSDGATTAQFLSGGPAFTVGPNPVGRGGGVARVALKSENGWGAFAIEGGAEARDGLTAYDVKLAAHFRF